MQKIAVQAARIVEQRSHIVPGALKITEHFFEVPRDYSSPSSGTLRLFARSARKHDVPVEFPGPSAAENSAGNAQAPQPHDRKPWLIFLNGGPGVECSSPQRLPWVPPLVEKGYQVLCLDQRGTGLSSPLSVSTLGLRGDDNVQAKYLQSFRADNIVRDSEAIRLALTAGLPETQRQWSVFGQSFGGFCATSYLSMYPEGLREVFLTGGTPPLVNSPDEVYRRLWRKCAQRNEKYYEKFPADVARVKTICKFLDNNTIRLPSDAVLTVRRFLQIGMAFGASTGIDSVHEIVIRAINELDTVGHLTRQTADIIDRTQSYDNNIIYAILHEPIYCQGEAPKWSAWRTMQENAIFDLDATLEDPTRPVYFTGEMIFPWMFEDSYSQLKPLAGPAMQLADHSSWPQLYDQEQLRHNTVPVYAAIYVDDMYVDFEFALETAHAIKGCKYFITNQIYHDGIRSKVDRVINGLWKLRTDVLD